MAIQISGTTVINNSRELQNIASLDATTTATIGAAAGGGSITATASGTLANGDTVCLNSDGTVSAITGSEVSFSQGSNTSFPTAANVTFSSVFDPVNNKVVVFYRDSSLNLKGIVGTVSGSSISFGSQQNIAGRAEEAKCSYDASQSKILVVYRGVSPYYGVALAVTVSGTSLSVGTAHTFNADETLYMSVSYDANAQKHLVIYGNNFTDQRAEVLTMSGTSISSGSNVVLHTAHNNGMITCYDNSAQKHAVFYKKASSANETYVKAATISGTSVSFGADDSLGNSGIGHGLSAVYDPDNGGCIFAFYDTGKGQDGEVVRVTISGTTATFGNRYTYDGGTVNNAAKLVYDEDSNQVVVLYLVSSSGYMQALKVNGDVFTNLSGVTHSLGTRSHIQAAYDTNANKVVINSTSVGAVIQVGYANSNVNNENFIGFSDGAYSNGATATIQVVGSVDDAQSGLTTGRRYYVHADGSLKTYSSAFLPDAYAGLATAATKILVKG